VTPDAFKLLKILGDARIVGGAVRDNLLGVPVHDIDIATSRTPDEVMAMPLHTIPTGIDHGTITVIYKDNPYEVTTLREDIETDGRFAVVRFGKSYEKDAARRDFTMNALSMDAKGVVYDYFNGIEDAKAGRVRFIGDAKARIKEDYLRILRFFRFTSRFGTKPDADGLAACLALQAGLDGLSRERVRDELMKAGLEFPPDILKRLIGDYTPAEFKSDDPVLRLAQIAVKKRDDAKRLKGALKLSNEVYRRLDSLAVGHAVSTLNEAKAMLYSCGKRGFLDRITLYGAYEFIDLPTYWMPPAFPITGEMLKAQGFNEGVKMGAELARLKAEWLAGGCAF
jgi:poly(A) polymerase